MLVGAPIRGAVTVGQIDPEKASPSTAMLGLGGNSTMHFDPKELRWGQILLRTRNASPKQTGSNRPMNKENVCLFEQPTRLEEQKLQVEGHQTALLVPAGFRKDAISLQEIDQLPCSRTFFCCSDFFATYLCCGLRVHGDWRVYVYGDAEEKLTPAEEKRLYQWVLVNGTLDGSLPLREDLLQLDLFMGNGRGRRLGSTHGRISLAKWCIVAPEVLAYAILVAVLYVAVNGGKLGLAALLCGVSALAFWTVIFIVMQVADSAASAFGSAVEELRKKKNHVTTQAQVGSPSGPVGSSMIGVNGENKRHARKSVALITDVLLENGRAGCGPIAHGGAEKGEQHDVESAELLNEHQRSLTVTPPATASLEDRAMVQKILSRLGEHRRDEHEVDARIVKNSCYQSGFRFVPAFTFWLLTPALIFAIQLYLLTLTNTKK
eukprot:g11672.t1